MIFNQDQNIKKVGEVVGYTSNYFLFTTILFFIFGALKNTIEPWTYINIMAITALITLFSFMIGKILK